MAFQTFENDENNRVQIKRKNLKKEIRSTWLGRRDSNPRMLGPEPSALPLGESPVQIEIIALGGERVKLSDLAVARMYCGGIYST